MENQVNFHQYLTHMKEFYNSFIDFIDNSENDEKNFNQIINLIDTNKCLETREEIGHFIQLLVSLCNNHYRGTNLIQKVELIIQHYKDKIQQNYSNAEIFDLFCFNKILLHILFKNSILTLDEHIYSEIMNKEEANGNKFCYFFIPELESFKNSTKIKQEINPNILNNYEKKRQEGENESHICHLIRQDSIEEFIQYINKNFVTLDNQISHSIYETNPFLIENNPTLIEYAIFFNSNKIFQYLFKNGIELKPSMWLYAIHGQNSEVINVLEENKIKPLNKSYEDCFVESIKCHHNNFVNYFEANYGSKIDEKITELFIQYNNYEYFEKLLDQIYTFFYLYKHHFLKIVDLYLKHEEPEIIKKIEKILKQPFFFFYNGILYLSFKWSYIIIVLMIFSIYLFNEISCLFFFYSVLLKRAAYVSDIVTIYYLLSKRKEIDVRSFENAEKLPNIVIPSSITRIGNYAFNNCKSLKNILFASPSSLEFIGDFAFSNCKSLSQITIPKSVTKIGELAFRECLELQQVVFEAPSSLKTIGNTPFHHCNKLIKFININPCFTMDQLIGKIHVTIKNITMNNKFEMDLEHDKLIENLRQYICEHYGAHKSNAKIFKLFLHDGHNSRIDLTDGTKVSDYDINEGSIIFVSTNAIRGG